MIGNDDFVFSKLSFKFCLHPKIEHNNDKVLPVPVGLSNNAEHPFTQTIHWHGIIPNNVDTKLLSMHQSPFSYN